MGIGVFKTPAPLPPGPPPKPTTLPEVWTPSAADIPPALGLARTVLFRPSAAEQAGAWLGQALERIFPGAKKAQLFDTDAAFQTLIASPIGHAASLILEAAMISSPSRADEIQSLDRARQLLELQIGTAKNRGAFRAEPKGPPSPSATVLAVLALRQVLARSPILEGEKSYLLFGKELKEALAAAEGYLDSLGEDAFAGEPPELYALHHLLALVDAAQNKSGAHKSFAKLKLPVVQAAAALSHADLDHLPLMAGFLVPVLALLEASAEPPSVASRIAASFGAGKPKEQVERSIGYLAGQLLEQQHPGGGFYDSTLFTELAVAALLPVLDRAISPGERTRIVRAVQRAVRYVERSQVDLAQLEAKYQLLLSAKLEGKAQIAINRELGALRQAIARSKLEQSYPDAKGFRVFAERDLFHQDAGTLVKAFDPVANEKGKHTARRLDLVVVDINTSRVVRAIEVTSGPGGPSQGPPIDLDSYIAGGAGIGASKTDQMAKEQRIRGQGPVYVRAPGSHEPFLLPQALATEIWRIA